MSIASDMERMKRDAARIRRETATAMTAAWVEALGERWERWEASERDDEEEAMEAARLGILTADALIRALEEPTS